MPGACSLNMQGNCYNCTDQSILPIFPVDFFRTGTFLSYGCRWDCVWHCKPCARYPSKNKNCLFAFNYKCSTISHSLALSQWLRCSQRSCAFPPRSFHPYCLPLSSRETFSIWRCPKMTNTRRISIFGARKRSRRTMQTLFVVLL